VGWRVRIAKQKHPWEADRGHLVHAVWLGRPANQILVLNLSAPALRGVRFHSRSPAGAVRTKRSGERLKRPSHPSDEGSTRRTASALTPTPLRQRNAIRDQSTSWEGGLRPSNRKTASPEPSSEAALFVAALHSRRIGWVACATALRAVLHAMQTRTRLNSNNCRLKPNRTADTAVAQLINSRQGGRRAIGIGGCLATPPSHTTGRTGPCHGGSAGQVVLVTSDGRPRDFQNLPGRA
jgi:hypothetical protein